MRRFWLAYLLSTRITLKRFIVLFYIYLNIFAFQSLTEFC